MTQKNSISEEVKISIINYLSGKWDECDSVLLNGWIEQSPENKKLFGQLVDLWEADNIIRREKEFDTDEAWTKFERQMNSAVQKMDKGFIFSPFLRYAAIFILALFIGGLGYAIFQNKSGGYSSNMVEYTAPYGSKTSLKLLDGSQVWLNAGTTLKYNQGFGKHNRDIELSGEAYFEVAKNKNLPFVVKAKKISVTALGTRFNVKAYPEETVVETCLLEGSVKLQNLTRAGKQELILKPEQKSVFNLQNHKFLVTASDASEISWTTDKWVIRNTKMGEFSRLLERRYNVDFTFSDSRIKGYEFGGTIKDETIEQVLTAISLSAPVKYKIVNNHVTLSIDESKLSQYKTLLRGK